MSNRLFQTVIQQMKDAVGRVIGVVDENGDRYTNVTVDTDNIGITGISWGGWSTAMMGVVSPATVQMTE